MASSAFLFKPLHGQIASSSNIIIKISDCFADAEFSVYIAAVLTSLNEL